VSWNNVPEWAKAVTKSILETVKAKDPYTFYHFCRVGRNSRLLGKAAGMNEYQQIVLEYSGLFHDVGKVGIPDNILFKPAKLTLEELHMMKMHPIKSLQIMKPLMHEAFFKDVSVAVELHHERIDGRGYPYGLTDKNISELVRMVTLVDAVDAMISTRPYKKAMPHAMVMDEIRKHAGTQFDEQLVKIYLQSEVFFKNEIKEIKLGDQIAHSLLVAS
jgi:HD-GYP domain-containing protein (c-di-GMP phosphodiesterase class II)